MQHFVILTFFVVVFHALFALFLLTTIDVVYVNLERFKHVDSSYHFLELNYRGKNFNFIKLQLLLIDGDRVKSRAYTK